MTMVFVRLKEVNSTDLWWYFGGVDLERIKFDTENFTCFARSFWFDKYEEITQEDVAKLGFRFFKDCVEAGEDGTLGASNGSYYIGTTYRGHPVGNYEKRAYPYPRLRRVK